MRVEFDRFGNFEDLSIVLCQPASQYDSATEKLTHVIGNLDVVTDEEFVCNWNDLSEFNLRVWDYVYPDPVKTEQSHSVFKKVELMRLLFVHNIGYFQISHCESGWDDNGRAYKDLTCQSIECELNNRNIPYMPNATIKMQEILEGGTWINTTGSSTTNDPFEGLYSRMGSWTLSYIDESLMDEYRTFEDVDVTKSVYQFLIEDVQEAFECFCIFDIMNRTIQIYKKEDYQHHTSIHLSREDNVEDLKIQRDAEDVYTCINVQSDDETTLISAINPCVDNRLYDFTYFLDWMTPALAQKVERWQEEVDAAREEYAAFSLDFYEQMTIVLEAEQEASRLEILYTQYDQMRCNLVAELSGMTNAEKQAQAKASRLLSYNTAIRKAGGEEIPSGLSFEATCLRAKNLAEQTLAQLNEAVATRDKENEIYEGFLAKQQEYRDTYNIQCYFTEDEYNELSHYIFEGDYSDPYTTTLSYMVYRERFKQMELLYERALKHLKEAAQPTLEYEVTTESFIFEKRFREWSDQLVTGSLINLEIEDGEVVELVLNNMTINYDDKSISLSFGNTYNKFDPRSLFVSAMGSIRKTTNSIGVLRNLTSPFKDGRYNEMADAIQRSRDLTMDEVLHSYNEEVIIDEFGYTGRRLDGDEYDPRQVKLISKDLVFTKDGWESCCVALGEIQIGGGETYYGLNAEVICGDLIFGNQLTIKDNNGNNLLDVMDGRISASVTNPDTLLGSQLLMLENSINTQVSGVYTEIETVKTTLRNEWGEEIGDLEEQVENVYNYTSSFAQTDKQIMLQVVRSLVSSPKVSDSSTTQQVKTAFFNLGFTKNNDGSQGVSSNIRLQADNISWSSDYSELQSNGTFISIDGSQSKPGSLTIKGGLLDGVSGDTNEHSYIYMRSEIRDAGSYGISDTVGSNAWLKCMYLDSSAICLGADKIGVAGSKQGTKTGGKYYWGQTGKVGGFEFTHGVCTKIPSSISGGSSVSGATIDSAKPFTAMKFENGILKSYTQCASASSDIYGSSTGGLKFSNGFYTGGSLSSNTSGLSGYFRFKDGEGYWNGFKYKNGLLIGYKYCTTINKDYGIKSSQFGTGTGDY